MFHTNPDDGWLSKWESQMSNVVDGAQKRGDIAPGIHKPEKPTRVRVDTDGVKARITSDASIINGLDTQTRGGIRAM